MSMNVKGNGADIVTNEFLEKVCPKAFNSFLEVLKKGGVSLQSFFDAEEQGNVPEDIKEGFDINSIDEAYKNLQDGFNKNTKLVLSVVYNDKESKSDDLDGGAWAVDGVYGRTEAGEKYAEYIQHFEWTYCG